MSSNTNARGRAAVPLKDAAPRSGVVEEFDVPNDPQGDNLWAERTQDFGSIRTIGLRNLTPLNEKAAAAAAKGDPLLLAFELCRRAVAYVKSDVGGGNIEVFSVAEHDGSSSSLWAQMHPKLRTLAMTANADISVPAESTQRTFLASRRTVA